MGMKRKYFWFLLIPLYIGVMIFQCMHMPIDSDYSNLVLEANDILQGNIFLTDWNLTGISFITTDLLFFVIGAVFGGISPLTYYIAIGSMIAVAIILGFFLCEPTKRLPVDIIIYVALTAIPCTFAVSVLRAHTGAICWVFLSILCIHYHLQKPQKKYLILVFFALTLGCIGDAITMIVGVLPLLIYSSVILLSKEKETLHLVVCKQVIVISVLSTVCGFILDKFYFIIGGANKNDFLGGKIFEPLENWGNKFVVYLKSIFMIEDAAFFNHTLLSLKTLCYFVNTCVVIIGFVLVIRTLWKFISRAEEDTDNISVLLSLGFVVISLIFIITNVSGDIGHSRYIAYTFIAFSVLIVRNREWLSSCTRLDSQMVTFTLAGLSVISFSFRVIDLHQSSISPAVQKELGDYLASHDLYEGYGSFWDASSTTVSSENQVRIRAINYANYTGSFFGMSNWFCKNSWYNEKATFVVATEGDGFGVTPENVVRHFGEPNKILKCQHWDIFIYNKNLSKNLFNGLSDNHLTAREFYYNEHVEYTQKGEAILHTGAILFGPYEEIDAGTYTLVYSGDNLDCMTVDIYSNEIGLIDFEIISQNEHEIVGTVVIPSFLSDVEFREFNNSSEEVIFNSLSVTQ